MRNEGGNRVYRGVAATKKGRLPTTGRQRAIADSPLGGVSTQVRSAIADATARRSVAYLVPKTS